MKIKTFIRKNTWFSSKLFEVGWGNGYVILPPDHMLVGCKDLDAYSIYAHGGITYTSYGEQAQSFIPCPIDPKSWVIGFDTAHYMDNSTNWPQEKVLEETLRLKKEIEDLFTIKLV
jgi:hypothetical protein